MARILVYCCCCLSGLPFAYCSSLVLPFSSLVAPSLPHHLHSNHSFTSKVFCCCFLITVASLISSSSSSSFCSALKFWIKASSLLLLLCFAVWVKVGFSLSSSSSSSSFALLCSFGFFPPSSFSSSPASFLKSFWGGAVGSDSQGQSFTVFFQTAYSGSKLW